MADRDLTAVALLHYRRRQRLAVSTAVTVQSLWRELDRSNLAGSWLHIGPRVTRALTTAQQLAASTSDSYVSAVLAAQNYDGDQDGTLVPQSLAGIASDGRVLTELVRQPLIGTLERVSGGMSLSQALGMGRADMDRIVRTQVADAGRVGDGVAGNTRRGVDWYVRVMTPPSCSRCAVLAGKFYRMEKPFLRHPRCDCLHMAVGSKNADLTISARDYFDSLSRSAQDSTFTKAGAAAIREGADINQIVNARRGMSTAGSFNTGTGADTVTHRGTVTSGVTTTEGMTRRGFAGRRSGPLAGTGAKRLTPEAIYALSSDREQILSLLRRYGYIS